MVVDGIIDLHQMARYMTTRIADAMGIRAIEFGDTDMGDAVFIQEPRPFPEWGFKSTRTIIQQRKYWALRVDNFDPKTLQLSAKSAADKVASSMMGGRVDSVLVPDRIDTIEDHVRVSTIVRGLAYFGVDQ